MSSRPSNESRCTMRSDPHPGIIGREAKFEAFEARLAGPALPPAGAVERLPRKGRIYLGLKRAIDVAGAAAGLAAGSPLLLAAAIAIRLESPGPAIFRQTRVGQHGVPFTLYKFRGMYTDARERFPELYAYRYSADEVQTLVFHPPEDPRVTRVGRFLRRTSIDELPNLWNVLKGDMSLVGPRPEIPEMLPYYGDARDLILSAKPGVTSPAKADGRDELTFAETLELDLEYAKHQSLWLDLRVLGKTLVAVLRQDGVS